METDKNREEGKKKKGRREGGKEGGRVNNTKRNKTCSTLNVKMEIVYVKF